MKKMRKGFTIVELVIVIAVIAILTAVLVPTFSNLVTKANISADAATVKTLNTYLATNEAETNKKPENLTQVIEFLETKGFDLNKYRLLAKNHDLLWNQDTNRFIIKNGDEVLNAADENADYKLWGFYDQVPTPDKQRYNIYLRENSLDRNVEIVVGFDAGKNLGVNINYNRTTGPNREDVVIRTNGGTLTVNAVNATINHINNADKVIVNKTNSGSYKENGSVGVSMQINGGNVVIAQNTVIGELKLPKDEGTNNVSLEIKENTKIKTFIVENEEANVNIAQNTTVEQVMGDTTNISGAGAAVVEENKIVPTYVYNTHVDATATQEEKLTLVEALNAEKEYIVLAEDINLSSVYVLTNSVTIDGAGHKITSTANRIFRIGGSDIKIIFKNVDMKTTYASSDSRGISIDSQYQNISLLLDNVSLKAKYYALNVTGVNGSGSLNVNVEIVNSTIEGWAAINNHASLATFKVSNSTLIGNNSFSAAASNNFATIVFDGSNYCAEGSTAYGSKITVVNSTLRQITKTTNKQAVFSSQYGNVTSEVIFDTCVIEHEGENARYFNYAYSKENNVKIYVDGELVYEGY